MVRFAQQLMNRYPVLAAVFFLCLGTVLSSALHLDSDLRWLVPIAAVLGIVSLVKKKVNRTLLWLSVGMVFFLLGLHQAARELSWGKDFFPSQSKIVVRAMVVKTLASRPNSRVLLLESGKNVSANRSLPGKGRLVLWYNDVPLAGGDVIALLTRVRKPLNRGNPGEYGWETHCRNNGIGWLVSAWGEGSVLLLRKGSSFRPTAVIFRVRSAMGRFLDAHAGLRFNEDDRHKVRAVLKGIILGDRGELTLGSTREVDHSLGKSFERSGLAHMLSASGLHVGIVVLMTVIAVRFVVHARSGILLWLPFAKLAAFACIPAVMSYCLIVGSRVPVMRATIMTLVFASAVLAGRRWNSINSLAVAALLILLVYPLSLLEPSFQLSFVAVFGILLVVKPVTERLYRPSSTHDSGSDAVSMGDYGKGSGQYVRAVTRPVTGLVLTSAAATIAVTPLLLYTFHGFPIYTLPANLLAGFVLTAALSLGLLATFIGAVFPSVGAVLLFPVDVLVWIIIEIAEFFAGLPFSSIRVGHPGWAQFAFALGACFSLLFFIRSPSRKIAALLGASVLGFVCATLLGSWARWDNATLKATFLNVGNADAAFVLPPDSRGLLIDGGLRTEHFDSGWSIVIPFLQWSGIGSLDSIILSHPQMDHMGGLRSVMSQVRPTRIFRNVVRVHSPEFTYLMTKARAYGIPVADADRYREPIQVGKATLTFLNPPCPATRDNCSSSDVNNASVVFRLDFGRVSFLFTGDLERKGEEELLESGVPLEATILKVGHHGGNTSTSERFLDAVKPAIAVISADHPPRLRSQVKTVVERMESRHIEVLWTGRDGAITIESDGRNVTSITTGKAVGTR